MVSGAMFDPLVELLRDRFRMLNPDLRGHGKSGDLAGPYDVAVLAADLDIVLAEARFDRSGVMGYSHGGAVAQQLAHTRPAVVSKLILACTYACGDDVGAGGGKPRWPPARRRRSSARARPA
jgi:3-oxoadipate enol-lactonase